MPLEEHPMRFKWAPPPQAQAAQGAIDAIEGGGAAARIAAIMQALPPPLRDAIAKAIASGRITPDEAMRIIAQLYEEGGMEGMPALEWRY